MGFHTFVSGEVLTAANVNSFLMNQSVIACTSGTRPASPTAGMTIYQTDTNSHFVYNGTSWGALLASHSVQTTKSTGGSITASTWTTISWDVNDFDTDSFHSTVTNPSRITIPTGLAGKYTVNAKAYFTGAAADNEADIAIIKNGATSTVTANQNGLTRNYARAANFSVATTIQMNLSAGDFLEMVVFCNAAPPTLAANNTAPAITCFGVSFDGF